MTTDAKTALADSPQTRTMNVRFPQRVSEELDEESAQVQEVLDAISDMERGKFASDEEVNAVFAKYGA
jgi:predicted transcriptional regulator